MSNSSLRLRVEALLSLRGVGGLGFRVEPALPFLAVVAGRVRERGRARASVPRLTAFLISLVLVAELLHFKLLRIIWSLVELKLYTFYAYEFSN